MKTKLYTLLTGLLMAACLTSFGQEIVSEFTLKKDNMNFFNCSLFENKDGSLLFGTQMYNPNNYEEWGHLFYKITPEGEILDSLIIDAPDLSKMFRNPEVTDSYIVVQDDWTYDETDSVSILHFNIFFIDAGLHITNEISVPTFSLPGEFYYTYSPWFIDTQNDFILSIWAGDVLHLARVGFDGTIKATAEHTGLFAPNYDQEPCGADSTLIYSDMGFGVFSESPLTYYLLGGYYPASGPFPIIGYFFDEDFRLIDRRLYEDFSDNIAFDGGNTEHILPLADGSYLTVAQISQLSPTSGGVGLAKFDMNHNPICASPLFGSSHCYPRQTLIADDNTIYQLYDIGGGWTTHKWALARLNGELNVDWEYTLPQSQIYAFDGTDMIKLENGDIALLSICRRSSMYRAVVVILRDTYDSTPETTNMEPPFTLYPNPVKGLLSLRFDDGEEPESVELYNLVGRLVASRRNDIESIDMSTMSSGVYTLCVTMKDGTRHHHKVIKE